MKTLAIPGASLLVGLLITATAQTPAPQAPAANAEAPAVAPAAEPTSATEVKPNDATAAPATAGPAPAATATPAAAANREATAAALNTDKPLTLNFRGAPLEMVLNYMSDAAGFIIVLDPKTELSGRVDVWSSQPVSKEEAFRLLEKVLKQNGYAAIRNDRILTIVRQEEAKKRDLPVIKGSDPDEIPKTDQIVTQIIPVRHANATQLTRDLQPLLADYALMTANESGNALVLTATQADIRRMAEIVDAIDSSISSGSSVQVFPLKHADAKELATVIRELFDTQSNNRGGGNRGGGFNPFAGPGIGGFGGGPGGFGGGNFGRGGDARAAIAQALTGGGRGSGSGNVVIARVTAVADERTNSLIVSAPEDVMPTIRNLVREMDVMVADVTEVRVFRLRNADPVEMADILAELFPDPTTQRSSNGRGGDFPFGGFRFNPGGGGRGANANAASSERMLKMDRVIAVPDERTSSVIVSASSQIMDQIGAMIRQLDSDSSRKQKVFVYSLENADVQNVEEILRNMFEGENARMNNRRNNNQNNNALNNRAIQTQRGLGGGNTGFGGGRGGGGIGGNNLGGAGVR